MIEQTASENLDWSVLKLPGVMDVLGRAARRVADRYESAELDDLLQEAAILAATNADQVRTWWEEDHLDYLFADIQGDLSNPITTALRRGESSLDAMLEARAEDSEYELELADGDDVPQRQRVRNGEYGGMMAGLRWCAPTGNAAGGKVTVRQVGE